MYVCVCLRVRWKCVVVGDACLCVRMHAHNIRPHWIHVHADALDQVLTRFLSIIPRRPWPRAHRVT